MSRALAVVAEIHMSSGAFEQWFRGPAAKPSDFTDWAAMYEMCDGPRIDRTTELVVYDTNAALFATYLDQARKNQLTMLVFRYFDEKNVLGVYLVAVMGLAVAFQQQVLASLRGTCLYKDAQEVDYVVVCAETAGLLFAPDIISVVEVQRGVSHFLSQRDVNLEAVLGRLSYLENLYSAYLDEELDADSSYPKLTAWKSDRFVCPQLYDSIACTQL